MAFSRPAASVLLAAAVALTAALVGCSSSASTGDGMTTAHIGKLEQSSITIAAVPTTDSSGLYVAEYDGLFEKYGLHVKIVPAISAESSINQLALNQIQILSGNYVSAIEAQINYDNHVKPVNVPFPPGPTDAQISANLDVFAEASVMQPGFVGLFTGVNSPIRTINQLKGKTIGINAPGNVAYLLVAGFMAANGLPVPAPDDTKVWKIIPFPNMENALLQGKVNVAFLAEPFVSISEDTAGVTELTNMDQGATTAFPIQGYMATKSYARSHPNTMAAFETALEQGQQIATSNHTVAEAATVKYGLIPNMPPSTPHLQQFAGQLATLLQFESYPVGPVDVTRLKRVANVMTQFGVFKIPSDFSVKELLGD